MYTINRSLLRAFQDENNAESCSTFPWKSRMCTNQALPWGISNQELENLWWLQRRTGWLSNRFFGEESRGIWFAEGAFEARCKAGAPKFICVLRDLQKMSCLSVSVPQPPKTSVWKKFPSLSFYLLCSLLMWAGESCFNHKLSTFMALTEMMNCLPLNNIYQIQSCPRVCLLNLLSVI